MYPDSSEGLNKETDRAIYFFTAAFHPLDNFSAHAVEIWGKRFMTSEHAFHWIKFRETSSEIADSILLANSPEAALRIAKTNRSKRDPDWDAKKVGVMKEILRQKMKQNPAVQEALTKSGNREIVENSPDDDFWGNGPNGDGTNHLGRIWMELRDEH